MNDKERDAAIHMLLGMRAQIDALVTLLARTSVAACRHENRADQSVFGAGGERWSCKDCGFEYPPQTADDDAEELGAVPTPDQWRVDPLRLMQPFRTKHEEVTDAEGTAAGQ